MISPRRRFGPAAVCAVATKCLARESERYWACLSKVTVANAGHLPPYRNGEELVLDPDLPLGIAPEVQYAEHTFRLELGDRMTLLSDGVVEARDARGDLFGFERTRAISAQSAGAIAAAALAYGQADDITVLTLTRGPAAVVIDAAAAEEVGLG